MWTSDVLAHYEKRLSTFLFLLFKSLVNVELFPFGFLLISRPFTALSDHICILDHFQQNLFQVCRKGNDMKKKMRLISMFAFISMNKRFTSILNSRANKTSVGIVMTSYSGIWAFFFSLKNIPPYVCYVLNYPSTSGLFCM